MTVSCQTLSFDCTRTVLFVPFLISELKYNHSDCFLMEGLEVKKGYFLLAALLLLFTSAASAVQTAAIVSRNGIQAGLLGGYSSALDYIGGIGGSYELELPLSKAMSLSFDAGGGYNALNGSLAGGGLDFKYSLAKLKQINLAVAGFGSGYYQFPPLEGQTANFLYGGGAIFLATLDLGYFKLTGGAGASYDIYGDTDGRSDGRIGLVGRANLLFPLSKATDIGLAFEYGGDRFFLGAVFDFGVHAPVIKKAAPVPAKKAAPAKAPAPAKKAAPAANKK
jgi:hypothetical protein